jgi:hypothetical protein
MPYIRNLTVDQPQAHQATLQRTKSVVLTPLAVFGYSSAKLAALDKAEHRSGEYRFE